MPKKTRRLLERINVHLSIMLLYSLLFLPASLLAAKGETLLAIGDSGTTIFTLASGGDTKMVCDNEQTFMYGANQKYLALLSWSNSVKGHYYTLWQIDRKSGTLQSKMPVDFHPVLAPGSLQQALGVDPQNNEVYFAGYKEEEHRKFYLYKVNFEQQKVAEVNLPNDIENPRILPTEEGIYVYGWLGSRVSFFSFKNQKFVEVEDIDITKYTPSHKYELKPSAVRSYCYVPHHGLFASNLAGGLQQITGESLLPLRNSVVKQTNKCVGSLHRITLMHKDYLLAVGRKDVVVGDESEGMIDALRVYDPETMALVADIAVPFKSNRLTISSQGDSVYMRDDSTKSIRQLLISSISLPIFTSLNFDSVDVPACYDVVIIN